ncbi:MAG: hypothetical protein A2W93_01250 [Bacteroidetes bacterium GWF2_43_63]|nr:MAG: hypothetical protein A2W94_10820 [Bacteroidetes bacterium GWE2_42_42]OFY55705.1 MAG: hypothetical protein A2W93_01250 [Bacteroidetes bacterium GWF2_43_63]HBG69488.1 hypothetical protein [Bacteroidales bacterium]HCB61345.1 hypothetical protein [Bacteroidales bacterium]HCY24220.1 hypothetical protein [Bacteroidales bacterium]
MSRLVLIIFSTIILSVCAQSQEADYVVKLVKTTDFREVCYLQEGKRICLIDQSGKRFAGNLILPNDSELVVSDKHFFLADIRYIQTSGVGRTMKKVFGGFLGSAGLLLTGAGFAVIMDAVSSNTPEDYIILIPLGLITAGIGTLATLQGVFMVFSNENEFDVQNKWDIEIIPATDLATD